MVAGRCAEIGYIRFQGQCQDLLPIENWMKNLKTSLTASTQPHHALKRRAIVPENLHVLHLFLSLLVL